MVFSFLVVLGGFNRITFPAYLLVPGLQLLPHFRRKPLSLIAMVVFTAFFSLVVIAFDTMFYRPHLTTIFELFKHPVITPLNNFLYNYAPENLARHGLHPFYQHAVANLPQLLGPAIIFVAFFWRRSFRLYSALSAVIVLSAFPHQEARFLVPAIPLILSSVRLPHRGWRFWVASWIVFNLGMGALMGTFHQGGVVPMQIHISQTNDVSHVFWWRTYQPPMWLLDGKIEDVTSVDFMGAAIDEVVNQVSKSVSCGKKSTGVVLVAPASATELDKFTSNVNSGLVLKERFKIRSHLSLDDMDFAKDGVWATLQRVIGRRGLVMWDVTKKC
jgi:GPI mannosyltransferase 4